MARKAIFQPDDDDDDILLSKKAKRKLAKAAKANANANANASRESPASAPADSIDNDAAQTTQAESIMSKIALLCQEQHWREAALLCLQEMEKNRQEGLDEDFVLNMAYQKVEKSLRRQMAATVIKATEKMLSK